MVLNNVLNYMTKLGLKWGQKLSKAEIPGIPHVMWRKESNTQNRDLLIYHLQPAHPPRCHPGPRGWSLYLDFEKQYTGEKEHTCKGLTNVPWNRENLRSTSAVAGFQITVEMMRPTVAETCQLHCKQNRHGDLWQTQPAKVTLEQLAQHGLQVVAD